MSLSKFKSIHLFPLSLFFATSVAFAAGPHHETCLKAADYEGCIKVLTQGVSPSEGDALTKLRSAMKQVAARLSSGTSLRDSALVFQPVIDAQAVVPAEQHESLAYQSASMAIQLFDDTQAIWQKRISTQSYGKYSSYHVSAACKGLGAMVQLAALKTGNPSAFKWNYKADTGFMGIGCDYSSYPESVVYSYTVGVLRDGSTDPQEIADYATKLKDARRLAALGPWQRYLEKNPGMAAWAKANPELAKDKMQEYIKKNGSDQVEMPDLPSSLSYLKGTKVEKYL